MRSFLFALLFAVPSFAAVRLGPELPVAAPIPGPPSGQAQASAVVTDGTDFLIVWSTARNVNFTRVTADGKVVGAPHPPILTGGTAREISACWTGSAYLLAWNENADYTYRLMTATVARDGSSASPPREIVAKGLTASGALASNGRRALLTYAVDTGQNTIAVRGALLSSDGSLISKDIPLPVSGFSFMFLDIVPRVATDGNEFALVWRSGNFHLQRVNDDAEPVGNPIAFPFVEQTGRFGVAFGGGRYAIAAIEQHLIVPGKAQARLIRLIADPSRNEASALPTIDTEGYDAAVVWNGSQFIAGWMSYTTSSSTLWSVRFDPSATPVQATSSNRLAILPQFAWNGRNVLGAWSGTTTTESVAGASAVGARFDSTIETMVEPEPFLVSLAWSRQLTPAIATSGSDSLAVWIEDVENRYGAGRLLGRRMALNGAPIDKTPFEIAPEATPWERPAVTFAGDAYVVAWSRGQPPVAEARAVRRDGTLGAPVSLGAGWGAAAASNGSMALVAFSGIKAWRFNAAGEPIDTNALLISDDDGYSPQVASNGGDFFVAWNVGSDQFQFSPPGLIDVYGKRVTPAGAADAAPLPIATGVNDQALNAVAGDGRDYAVFYTLTTRLGVGSLAAKRVLREGQLDGAGPEDDGTMIVPAPNPYVQRASVVRDATGFWLAWGQLTSSTWSLKLAHIESLRQAEAPITLASWQDENYSNVLIALAQPPGGPLQISYARPVFDGPYAGTTRTILRFLGQAVDGRWRAAAH